MPDHSFSDCDNVDPMLTPYVDGELAAADRDTVASHVRGCAPCRARVEAEETVRQLVRARRPALAPERAPEALRARCTALARQEANPSARAGARSVAATSLAWLPARRERPARPWRARLWPLTVAATLVLVVATAFLYRLTESSTRVMAAELAADHVKCFMMNSVLGTSHTASAVESSMAARFGWDAHLPAEPERADLELVGGRPCLYGEGRVAHIMYRHNGKPVSVFMLPKKRRPEELLHVMGHEAAIWSEGDRTFVLIAREPRSEVQRIAEFVHASLR